MRKSQLRLEPRFEPRCAHGAQQPVVERVQARGVRGGVRELRAAEWPPLPIGALREHNPY
eukprot:7384647-Prymnesium_polylepis.1